jgi:cytochrome c551/c552
MKRAVVTIIGIGLALAVLDAGAQDAKLGEAKAKEAGCLACHAVASQKIGPSYRDVAKQYGTGDKILAAVKADKDHADQLEGVSDADLSAITSWIAGL